MIEQSNRQQGVATLLLSAAADFARESNVIRITLATQISNIGANLFMSHLDMARIRSFITICFECEGGEQTNANRNQD